MAREFLTKLATVQGVVVGALFTPIESDDLPRPEGLTAGGYTNPNLTVDQYGRVVAIESGGPVDIGDLVVGGTARNVLYLDADAKLAQESTSGQYFKYDTDGSYNWVGIGGFLVVGVFDGADASGGLILGGNPTTGVGAVLLRVTSTTSTAEMLMAGKDNSTQVGLTINGTGVSGSGSYLDVGGLVNGDQFTTSALSDVVKVSARAHASQSVNIAQFISSGGTVYSSVNKNGYYMTSKVAAPADAELANSQMAFWLTDTPAGAMFNVKAKDSAGNVVTGSFNLT